MAVQFIDGFDKYGPVSGNTTAIAAALATEWTAANVEINTGSIGTPTLLYTIVAGLSSTGYALNISNQSVSGNAYFCGLSKTLGGNLSRIVGGVRISLVLTNNFCIAFVDGTTIQCNIQINSSGQVLLVSGAVNGTTVATSTASISANTAAYLEWDITFGSSASYNIYFNGVSVLSGTGNTRGGTTNNYASVIYVLVKSQSNVTNTAIVDDLYVFDTTGSTNNAVLLTSPRIETTFTSGDSTVQFSAAIATLGSAYSTTSNTNAPGANELFLRAFTPAVNMTLNSVSCVPEATSAGANYKAVLYSDSSGSPGTLIATGTVTTGATSGTTLTSSFSSGQALTGGTQYWIGFITDTSVVLAEVDGTTTGRKVTNTYSSGAPSTAPAMTSGQASWLLYGTCSSAAANYVAENNNPPNSIAYVQGSTVGLSDLYSFATLSTNPPNVYVVGIKAFAEKSDSGARTVNLEMKSSGTISSGNLSSLALGTTYSWIDSYFPTDPGSAGGTGNWSVAGVNAATAGFNISS